jgi:hypothetical protein
MSCMNYKTYIDNSTLQSYEKIFGSYHNVSPHLFWVRSNKHGIVIPVNAQTPQFPNNTETATGFADVIEGNDTTTITNDTNISDTNNTLEDSTDVNIKEDCLQVPGQSGPYCP